MKNKVKLALSLSLVGVLSAWQPSVSAAGFPVGDIINAQQNMQSYLQDLMNYEQYMRTAVLEGSQLAEALRLYEQTMISYRHMLTQMEGLKQKLEARDWQAFYARYDRIINRYPGSTPDYDPIWRDAEKKVGKVFDRGSSRETVQREIDGLAWDQSSRHTFTRNMDLTNSKAELATNQAAAVAGFRETDAMDSDDLKQLDSARISLGPEDHLKTLQLLVDQNQKMLEFTQRESHKKNKEIELSNQLAAHVFERRKLSEEANLKIYKDIQSRKIVIDETPLVNGW